MPYKLDSSNIIDRFISYAKIDTESNDASSSCPSSEGQKILGAKLVQELLAMGIKDAHIDEFGYVYATIPSNSPKKIPVICFCSHLDTSQDCTGANVNPIVHRNYRGGNIVLPNDISQVLRPEDHPELNNQIGCDIITADGTTLLGADNKAGVAEIMEATQYLVQNPHIKHGDIKILFTPDEEIGRGTNKVDLKKLGADFAYTMDGSSLGHLEDENFSADGVKITVQGFSIHPGFAKDQMQSALKIATEIIEKLPKDSKSPETTENKEGFIHPISIQGTVGEAVIEFIIRDFRTAGLSELESYLKNICETVIKKYNKSSFTFEVTNQYRNMKEILDKHPQVVEYAWEAIRRSGIEPVRASIRGGTDGSRLSFMGLPCPNIFAGEQAFHGKHEWVSVRDMEKAIETIINLCQIWEERG